MNRCTRCGLLLCPVLALCGCAPHFEMAPDAVAQDANECRSLGLVPEEVRRMSDGEMVTVKVRCRLPEARP